MTKNKALAFLACALLNLFMVKNIYAGGCASIEAGDEAKEEYVPPEKATWSNRMNQATESIDSAMGAVLLSPVLSPAAREIVTELRATVRERLTQIKSSFQAFLVRYNFNERVPYHECIQEHLTFIMTTVQAASQRPELAPNMIGGIRDAVQESQGIIKNLLEQISIEYGMEVNPLGGDSELGLQLHRDRSAAEKAAKAAAEDEQKRRKR